MAELSLVAAWQRATHHLLTALDAELADRGLTPGEINALACFASDREVGVGELVARTGQRRSTFTGVLDRLETRGLDARRLGAGTRGLGVRDEPAVMRGRAVLSEPPPLRHD